ncbi:unnamed protein product, partial [marine sediment metagenome]
GDIEKFLLSLGDATGLSANISPWSDVELLGLQQLMTTQDTERIKRWAHERGLLKGENEEPMGAHDHPEPVNEAYATHLREHAEPHNKFKGAPPVPWDDLKKGDWDEKR